MSGPARIDHAVSAVTDQMTDEEARAYAASLSHARAQYEAGKAIPGEKVFEWLASWGSDKELPPPNRS